MTSYVDYEYYKGTFKGQAVPPEAFDEYAMKASAFIRYMTGGKSDYSLITLVKDATCAACEVYYKDEITLNKSGGRDVVSENTDGYSVSYAKEGATEQTHLEVLTRKAYESAYTHLAFSGLLSRRCGSVNKCGYYNL